MHANGYANRCKKDEKVGIQVEDNDDIIAVGYILNAEHPISCQSKIHQQKIFQM